MRTRDMVGFGVLPVVLLLMAWGILQLRMWDTVANMTLPWLLSAVGVAVLILGVVCLVMGVGPGEVPGKVTVGVVAGVMLIFGLGLMIDVLAYWPGREIGMPARAVPDLWACVGGWVGFGVILSGVFELARIGGRRVRRSTDCTD